MRAYLTQVKESIVPLAMLSKCIEANISQKMFQNAKHCTNYAYCQRVFLRLRSLDNPDHSQWEFTTIHTTKK